MDLKATQSNALIRANQNELTLAEKRIMLYLISLIRPEDEDFKYYRIYVDEFENLLPNKETTNQIFNCMNAVDKLEDKKIKIEMGDHITSTRLVLKSKYYVGHGYFDVLLDDELKPHLLDLKEHFTTIAIKQGLQLTSVNAVRLYEILKSWQSTGKMIVKVCKLKEMMGLEGKYKMFSQFKANCLKQIIAQINEITDIKVSMKERKRGRTVDQLTFSIKAKPKTKLKTKEEEQKEVKDKLHELNNPPTIHEKLKGLGIMNPSTFQIHDEIWEKAIAEESKGAPPSHLITTAKRLQNQCEQTKVEEKKKATEDEIIKTNKQWFDGLNFDSSKVVGTTNDAYVFVDGRATMFVKDDFQKILKPFIVKEKILNQIQSQ